MSKKPKNRNKKQHTRQTDSGRELEELLKACNSSLDVGFFSFHNLVKRYAEGPYRTTITASKLVPVEDYIKSAHSDLKSLEESLKSLSIDARASIKNNTSPEENLIVSIGLHQQFEDWTTSYQTSVTPTILELVAYLDDLDNPNQIVETSHE